MKPTLTSDCSLVPKVLFVDWLKILANEKQAVQFRSPLVLVVNKNGVHTCLVLSGTRHKIALKNRNVLCVVKLIHTKTVQTKTRKHQNVQTVRGPMLPITEVVLHARIKLLGNMWSKIKFLMPPL